ncbi:LuxR C-terminal-related transcriptional regulator [Aquamicrobium sp.]|uniref:LuxR C-terminal-related transcriptional regulator n=1 Tax=Aquamicrobium sp. TaxID=1872579 RepID=UPI00258688F9|nr:LuxR C-terminal-related transcriptional regulator [Aquamicrobium sp.]MCK9553600.1 LuxR C-terminal-related transcriptional regulator [Aquamicrobium sp.]
MTDGTLVAESHARCRAAGIDPSLTTLEQRLSAKALRTLLPPISGLISRTRSLFVDLHRNISAEHTVFALTVASGHIVSLHSCPEVLARIHSRCGMLPGVSLAEESCGTTAVAIALRHRMVAALRTGQHYCTLFQQCSSVAHPVNSGNGMVSACVAMFSHADDRLGEKVALVRCIANELSEYCQNSPVPESREPVIRREPLMSAEVPASVSLTARQRRVLALYAEGLSYKEITRMLGLASTKTVEEHLDAVRSKLNVTHRRQCIQRAIELGLLGQRRTPQ